MEAHQRYQNILDNVLLKNGIVTLTGTKDDVGCHVITFQSQQQLLFTQIDYSSLTESLYVIIMYYKSLPVSLLVNMSHSNQMFIGHFIHVVDQLERKLSKSEIKRVYIVRPERKSIQKHLLRELGSTSKDNARITAQVVIVKTFEELYQHVKRKNLTIDFGGTLEHDYRAWLAVQKILTDYYNLVNNVVRSSGDILQRIRDLTSEKLGSRTSGKDTEHAQKKRLQNLEKKRNTLLSQCSFTKAVEDSQRLRSYFRDPKLNSDFQAVSKSPVFGMDKVRFQQYYQKVLTLRDSIDHIWTDGIGNMKSLATEQELYDRLIECCTWIVEEGLPYLTSLPDQSKTLAEAVKQKITFENELFKPMKVTLKKCRQTLKGVRHYQRSLHTSSGSLDLMADNLTSLMENVKTKANERMEYLKNQKDFMQSLAKAESWCERASDLWPANQIPSTKQEKKDRSPLILSHSKLEQFLNKHPPLTGRELGHLLDYVDNIDDFELRTRARLLGSRCQELEKILRASRRQRADVDGEVFSSDHESSYNHYGADLSHEHRVHREENQSPLRSTISSDMSNKRWNDDVMSSTSISNDDATLSGSKTARLSTGNDSRLADIQRRLRNQELLYEQLILEEELRELSKSKSSPKRGDVNLSFDESFESEKNADISTFSDRSFEKGNRRQNGEGKLSETDFRSSFGDSFDSGKMSRVVDSGTSRKNFESVGKAEHNKKAKLGEEGLRSATLSSFSRRGNVKNVDEIVSPGTSTKVFVKRNDRKQQNHVDLRKEELGSTVFTSSLNKSGDVKNMKNMVESPHFDGFGSLDSCNTSCFDNGVLKPKETKHRSTTNLPSHTDLLDGCNSLKRLCNLGNTLPQNNNIPDFETYYNQAYISAQIPADPLLTGSNASTLSNGFPFEPRSSDFKSYSRDSESSRDASSEDFVKESPEAAQITYDSKKRSCDAKSSSHNFEGFSCDFKEQSRDSESKSLEELLKEAQGAVNHWTQVKNKQRARLTQVIDDISKRKEIEETYFNAQMQLCQAKRNFANLGKSDSGLNTSLSLNSDIPDCTITPSFNTSLRLGAGGDQVVDGKGAFRRYVKEEISVAQNSDSDEVCPLKGEKGTMLDEDDPVGIPGVNDVVNEGKVVLDKESSLGVTSDVKQDTSESSVSSDFTKTQSEKTAIPSGDRVILEENGNELDSEQGSSDEFDDAEEEELMLLCSQSSSDLLSQDELKNSLQGEQARLEEKFRQQNEQLKIEREKLMEEERRINEWQKNDGISIDGENFNVEGGQEGVQLVENTNGILNKGDDVGEISQPHVMKQLQHEMQQLQHGIQRLSNDTNKSQQQLPPLPTNPPTFKHDMTKTEHDNPAPPHETRFLQHEIPLPENEQRSVENDRSKQQKEKLHQDEKDHQHKPSESKPPGIEQQPQQEMMSFHEKFSYFEALNQNHTGPKQTKFVDKNDETRKNSPKKAVNDSVNAERDLNDLNEIVLSNVDSDDESRKKIEEELIEILQDRTLEIDAEKSQEQDQEAVPTNLPPLGSSCNPPSMLDNSDDIDLMNQLIDDLMISGHNGPSHNDEFSSDRTQQITGSNHEVNVDVIKGGENGSLDGGNEVVEVNNNGISFNDGEIDDCDIRIDVNNGRVNEDETRVSKGSIRLDVNNDDINLDNLEINVSIDLGDVVKSNEKPESSPDIIRDQDQGGHMKMENRRYNDLLGKSSRSKELGLHAIDASKDSGAIKSNDLIALLSNNEATSGDDYALSDDETARNKELGIDVDFTINLDKGKKEAQSNDLIGLLSSREATSGDENTLSENDSQQNDGLELDVDFTIDLNKHSEAVQGNDLIDLLRNQSGAFSSQESLVDDDYLTEVNFEIPNNSRSERLEREIISQNNQVHEGTTNDISQPERIVDINGERLGITGHTRDRNGITGRPGGISEEHHMSEESDDDDFGRVLEDIQEEESEYEDLMGYRPAQVDNENLAQRRAEIIAPITSAVRLSGQVKNEGNMSGSFTSSIIIDPGTGYCKAGFSIDDRPRVSIPSIVGTLKSQLVNSGRYKEYYVGEEAKHLHQALDLHRPLKYGLVQDWDLMEKLLDEIYEELRCESDQYPVLLSEPIMNPKSNREEMIQMMFETFQVPAAYSCAQAVLSLFATGRTTGLVYDCGYSKAHSVPVYEGYALPRGTTTVELAGHKLTTCLSRMLRDRGVTMETQTELDIVQDIKEKLCYVVVDYDSERKAYNTGQRNDTVYTMPDGQTVAIGSERFRCPEVLFTPSMVGMTTDGVHEVLYKTALQCAIDVRKSLFQNIVISGGSTMFPGFPRRLHVELCKLFGTMTPDSINIDAVEDRNALTWQGGAMLSKLSYFQTMWITSAEYNECGPGIVHKKCV